MNEGISSRCPICLGQLTQPAILSNCLHVFGMNKFFILANFVLVDLQCILQAFQLHGSLKRCPLCRAPVSLIFFNFNPATATCSVVDLDDAAQRRQLLLTPQSSTAESISEHELKHSIEKHDSVRTDVPFSIARSCFLDKTGFFSPLQKYRSKVYRYRLLIVDPFQSQFFMLVGLILYVFSLDLSFLFLSDNQKYRPLLCESAREWIRRELEIILQSQNVQYHTDYTIAVVSKFVALLFSSYFLCFYL